MHNSVQVFPLHSCRVAIADWPRLHLRLTAGRILPLVNNCNVTHLCFGNFWCHHNQTRSLESSFTRPRETHRRWLTVIHTKTKICQTSRWSQKYYDKSCLSIYIWLSLTHCILKLSLKKKKWAICIVSVCVCVCVCVRACACACVCGSEAHIFRNGSVMAKRLSFWRLNGVRYFCWWGPNSKPTVSLKHRACVKGKRRITNHLFLLRATGNIFIHRYN